MMLSGVTEVLETFRAAFQDARHDEWSKLYDTNVVLMRPHQTVMVDGPAEMLEIGRNVHESYTKLGLANVAVEIHEVRGFDPGIVMADVTWRYATATDEELIQHDCTYGLRRRANGYRICLHITHNEAVRRPMFLESSAPELLIGGII
ncbi:SnoaL-like domain-containing protein [Monaibacterium marinum]|uniref:SnoaL-like domain-containing protein n=1 Tax=Pontivivens marinum TaxID=1690039 RepID=A0A2C9CQ13_9RHOB|nr:nuclear transport factor 2 family protein [Monaibacterium marinum]SOH93424.1 SnoaL-like domain-containing protein [Monaibacterium marinum]